MVTKTEVGIINFNNSPDFLSNGQPNCNCGGIVELEWDILEITVVGLMGLALISGLFKGAFHLKNLVQKRIEKTRERKSNLELQLREKIKQELADKETADPNQTARQDADRPAEQEPDIARITYP